MKLIIIGPRSVGKSTIGKLLGRKLKLKYFDFDNFVENELRGVDEFIKNNSIKLYRQKESKLLIRFFNTLPRNFVVSVGGGTIASQFKSFNCRNIKLLKNSGEIIYLTPSENEREAINILFSHEQKRKGNKIYSEIKKLFFARKGIYEKIYDFKINVLTKTPTQISKEIILKLKEG